MDDPWAGVESVDDLSHPSTEDSAQVDDRDEELHIVLDQYGLGIEWDLLSPPDGGYAFVEFEDLEGSQKHWIARTMLDFCLARSGLAFDQDEKNMHLLSLSDRSAAATNIVYLKAEVEATADQVIEARRRSLKDLEEACVWDPQPARKGHLIAEGSMLVQAMNHVNGISRRQERRVIFTEPVSAFTCLYGDSIAKGGDMLTGVTVTKAEPFEVDLGNGKVGTRYRAKAIST